MVTGPATVDVTTTVLSETGPRMVVVYMIVCTAPDTVTGTVTGAGVTAGAVTVLVTTAVAAAASVDEPPLTWTTEYETARSSGSA